MQGQQPQGFNPNGFRFAPLAPGESLPPPDPVPVNMLPQNVNENVTINQPRPQQPEPIVSPGMGALMNLFETIPVTTPIARAMGGYYGAKQAQAQEQQQRLSEQQSAMANEALAKQLEAAGMLPAAQAIRAGKIDVARDVLKQTGSMKEQEAKQKFEAEQEELNRKAGIQKAQIYAGAMGHKPSPQTTLRPQRATAAEAESIADLNTALDAIQGIRTAKAQLKIDTGPVASRVNAARRLVGADDPQYTAFQAKVNNQLAGFILSLSGKAATDAERQFLKSVTPETTDNDASFNAKLDSLEEYIKAKKENRLESFLARGVYYNPQGAPARQPMTPGMIENMSEEELKAYLAE